MWKSCLLLLILAGMFTVGIECAKGNVVLFGKKTRLPVLLERVDGVNCPLYYSNEKQ